MGAYPIESVKFDSGETYLKLGSNYVPLANIKEVY
jgi:flagellar basal-body rod modification protein FlgD